MPIYKVTSWPAAILPYACPGWAGLRPAIRTHPFGVSGWEGTKRVHSVEVSGIDVFYCWAGLWPAIRNPPSVWVGWTFPMVELDFSKPYALTPSEWVGWTFPMVELDFGQPYTLTPSGWVGEKQPNTLSGIDIFYCLAVHTHPFRVFQLSSFDIVGDMEEGGRISKKIGNFFPHFCSWGLGCLSFLSS